MSAARLILSLVLVALTGYWAISSLMRYFEATEEVEDAKRELANVQKYGCENPIVNSGPKGTISYCPNDPTQAEYIPK